MSDAFRELPNLGGTSERPRVFCEDRFEWFPPGWSKFVGFGLECHLGRGHTNDHVAIMGSEDHPGRPCAIEVRW